MKINQMLILSKVYILTIVLGLGSNLLSCDSTKLSLDSSSEKTTTFREEIENSFNQYNVFYTEETLDKLEQTSITFCSTLDAGYSLEETILATAQVLLNRGVPQKEIVDSFGYFIPLTINKNCPQYLPDLQVLKNKY